MRRVTFAVIIATLWTGCIRPLPQPGRSGLLAPKDGAVLSSAEVRLLWSCASSQGDTGARCYYLQVAQDARFKTLAFQDTVVGESVTVRLMTDGTYFWRVKARNDAGVWGEWSEVWSFTVERFRVVGNRKTTGYPHDIVVENNYAYVADGEAGVAVYDVSEPRAPVFLGSLMDSLNVAWGVAVKESLVFVAYGYKELLIVNARNPESLKTVGALEYLQPAYGYGVATQDTWVYIAAGAQFVAVNVSDPHYPNVRLQYYYPRDCRDVVLDRNRAFLACGQLGVVCWRIDTFPPSPIGSMDTPGNARAVGVKGDLLFVADGRNGLLVTDVSDPQNMRVLGSIKLDGYAGSIFVDDTLVLVACGAGGVAIVNCALPETPHLVAQVHTPYAYAAAATEDRRYYLICDRDLGIVTVRKEE